MHIGKIHMYSDTYITIIMASLSRQLTQCSYIYHLRLTMDCVYRLLQQIAIR